MKSLEAIAYTGIYLQPLSLVGEYAFWKYVICSYLPRLRYLDSQRQIALFILLFMLSFIPTLEVWERNSIAKANGKKHFKIGSGLFYTNAPEYNSRRASYLNPSFPSSMYSRKPNGIVLGKREKYFIKPLKKGSLLHTSIIGSSGTGKSSAIIIPTLLNVLYSTQKIGIFCIDPKLELASKTVKMDDSDVLVLRLDQRVVGYDPFYRLSPNCSDQVILDTMKEIAMALIPIKACDRDSFWKEKARSLMVGLCYALYKKGVPDFITILNHICEKPLSEVITDILKDTGEHTLTRRLLSQYVGLAPETLSGIESNLHNAIDYIISDYDLVFALRDCPIKYNPNDLEECKKVFISIPPDKTNSNYRDILNLIVVQTLNNLLRRSENDHTVLCVLDELPSLVTEAQIPLLNYLRLLRSFNVGLIMAYQGVESLMPAYTREQVTDIMTNSNVVWMGGRSPETLKLLSEQVGKFEDRNVTMSYSHQKSLQQSYRERYILTPSDIAKLSAEDKVLVLPEKGFYIGAKAYYFRDKDMNKLSEEVKEYDTNI